MKRYFQGRWPTMDDFFTDFSEEREGQSLKRRKSLRLEGISPPAFAKLPPIKRRMNPARLENQSSQSATIRLSDGQDYDLKHILDIYRHSNGRQTLLRHPLTNEDRELMKTFLHHNDYNEYGKRVRGGVKTNRLRNKKSKRKIPRQTRRRPKQTIRK